MTRAEGWLVTGGAGYIGAHVVQALLASGRQVRVLDDLSTGLAERLPTGVEVVPGNVRDMDAVRRALSVEPAGVIHLAARKQVAESVARPLYYYDENVQALSVLLAGMDSAGVDRLLFCSSAAVYGDVRVPLVTEDTPCLPVNPYGQTKLVGEWMVAAQAEAVGLRAVSMRYFNVAGAGEPLLADRVVSNLVPMVFERLGRGEPAQIFGDDYPTEDGTCIRDFVHVADVADAHVAALELLDGEAGHDVFNVGTGRGFSVREVVNAIGRITGFEQPPVVTPKRAGDPPAVVADPGRLAARLGWTARRSLEDMITSAWEGWRMHAGEPVLP